jgi:hypothetical protein
VKERNNTLRLRQQVGDGGQITGLYPHFVTFTLFGLREADRQRDMRWHLPPKIPLIKVLLFCYTLNQGD